MHVLCNAVSHGIEPPEERRSRGKDVVGRVTLHLEAPGNRLNILVEDDGRGIDHRKVAEVAVQRGLPDRGGSRRRLRRRAGPPDLQAGLFHVAARSPACPVGAWACPSFTRRSPGSRARWTFGPGEGAGTGLVLSVPLSISTQRLLLVSCRGQTFAIPIHGIERLLRVKLEEVETVEGKTDAHLPRATDPAAEPGPPAEHGRGRR